MKSVSVFICSLLLVACAGAGKDDAWKGKHRDDLISYYGPPVKETELPDGGKEVVYDEFTGYEHCQRTYVIDQHEVITSWSKRCE